MCRADIESPYFDGDKFDPKEYTDDIPYFHDHGSSCYNCEVVRFASEQIRILISHENDLRHNRITWFSNIEGFLWLSFAAVISEEVGWQNGFWLLIVIPLIGILICFSAISAICDADNAVKLLVKKWRTIQTDQPRSPYTVIPVMGLSSEERKLCVCQSSRECCNRRLCCCCRVSVPRWHFALFVLVGWILGLTGVVLTKRGVWGQYLQVIGNETASATELG